MLNYEKLDREIIEYISLHYGNCPANSMILEMVAKKCNPHSTVPWRIVDRRTQALRKAGKIKLDNNRKWVCIAPNTEE